MTRKLSILIPCYNEENFIEMALSRIQNVKLLEDLAKEIIIVNDGSSDHSEKIIKNYISANTHSNITLLSHAKNKGKGACIQTALAYATGEVCIIQDADFDYDPSEYNKLLKPILNGYADVVYGSRFRGSEPHRVLFFFHTAGNKMLTFFSNLFTGLNLTDMETGYKMFRTEFLNKIHLKEKRFGFEPEVTAKISRIKNIRIYEVGISYYGRTYAEGKKIKLKDGFKALWCILKYNIFLRN